MIRINSYNIGMRKFKYVLGVLLFAVCLFSCKNRGGETYLAVTPVNLQGADTLVLKEMPVGDYLVSYPEAMLLADSALIVQDRKGLSCLFHLIGKNGKTDGFAFQGNGPGEYLDANLNPFIDREGRVGFYDSSQKKVLIYQKRDGKYEPCKVIKISYKEEWVREMVGCGDYYLLTGEHGDFSDFRFLVTDSLGKLLSRFGDYPPVAPASFYRPADDMRKLLFSSSFWRIAPDKTKAVFASYRGALIQFFDLSCLPDSVREIKSLQLAPPVNFSQVTAGDEGWIYGFEDVFVTSHFVYAIYNGQTVRDNPEFGRYILKYDWKGNMINTYIAPIGIRSLAVDEAQGLFYIAGYHDDEMVLYVAAITDNPM